ncbi:MULTISPECIES: nuclear transport factor 2 family protein [unclassified Sphingomonas]|uniref:nuclear transport factor 2 family protein n=1 Tax=unclassified Sphingomonas TaxID=196159 RepID=UPI002150E290|nr:MULTISPECIES: nuclear transport factor 2 family protein [unclassified Sphingomonas]MCR5870994.1 nuclear transport factor 2 family protein [Sphingomonas sp. J344]UUY00685.1 nuclear transport factor 2 family protein [Sphingomonas sp. J315]
MLLERRLIDEIEIQRLAAAYSHAVMRLDGAAAAATYAEDGVLTAFSKPGIVGRAAIAEALILTLEPLAFLNQNCGAGIISVDGDSATASWTVTELLQRKGEDRLSCCFGSYQDRLVRTADGWRFAHRTFVPFFRGRIEADGRSYPNPAFTGPAGPQSALS